MDKRMALMAGGLALALAAFAGGFGAGRLTAPESAGDAVTAGARGAFGGLSEADREKLQGMTDEERRAFLAERGITIRTPDGTAPGGVMRGGRGGLLEGKIAAVDGETLTIELEGGGSQKVYLDDDTVRARSGGDAGDIAEGDEVIVLAVPEADGVTGASVVVVK